jgi:AcrR family transcriptional regulator
MPTTRQRLTEAALRRFYRDGFRNVGLDQVLADVGISKTAFYKHFECKEDLVLAGLEMKSEWLQTRFRELLRLHGGATPLGQLRALLDVVGEITDGEDFQGCIFVNVAMEYPLPHEPAHVAAARAKQAVEHIVYELASGAELDDPQQVARELCLIMEGAYVTRQVSGNPESIAIARRIANLVIDAHRAASQKSTPTKIVAPAANPRRKRVAQ